MHEAMASEFDQALLRVLVAPSGYKECLEADRVAAAIAEGVGRGCPSARVVALPLVDGGEGFAAALAQATGGRTETLRVSGPLGGGVEATLGWLGGADAPTAIVEIAQAAGLRLVPRDKRNPMRTSSRGVGEMIRAALNRGAKRILVGCGDSGVNDGGAGMAQALGARLLDGSGADVERGCAGLAALDRIDMSRVDPRLARVAIEAACNTSTELIGPRGVARVFGPQKGADARTIADMDAAMERFAGIVARDLGLDLSTLPGAGASGGLGAGLAAFARAEPRSRYHVVFRYFDLDAHLDEADLVITAEGGMDLQTPNGKIPAEVGRRAKLRGLPVLALAGCVGPDARVVYAHGIDAFFSTCIGPCDLEEAMGQAEAHLALAAENLMRTVLAGAALKGRTQARRVAA